MKLELRKYQVEDLPQLVSLANNYNASRYLRNIFPHPYLESDAVSFFEHVSSLPKERGFEFAITIDNCFAGAIGVTFDQDIYQYTGELGYWLGEPFWGRNIMTKAIKLVIEHTFTYYPITKISAEVFSDNIGSQKVLENNGFKLEGILKRHVYKDNRYHDVKIYGLLKENL